MKGPPIWFGTGSSCRGFGVAVLLALLCGGPSSQAFAQPAPFQHIILIIQENRTPDNLFGSNPSFEPGVDIAANGTNTKGETIPLTAVALAGCYDLYHAHQSFTLMYDGGKMDGAGRNSVGATRKCAVPATPEFKYVDNSDGQVQPYFDIAAQYGFANRMFQTSQGPSFPAHQFLFGGTSAPTTDNPLFAAENNLSIVGPAAPGQCTADRSRRRLKRSRRNRR